MAATGQSPCGEPPSLPSLSGGVGRQFSAAPVFLAALFESAFTTCSSTRGLLRDGERQARPESIDIGGSLL